jgi:2-hydroxychromene-2-carboxylate isomerase
MTFDASAAIPRCDDELVSTSIEFYFDPMCPWAYQTSVWIRDVRSQIDLDITWRFFSLEEINRPEGKRHPWERPVAYGWTPMRVAAWLRRIDMDLCDRWYEACGRALHVDGRRFYDREVAIELLESIGAAPNAWDDAIADPTTHDDVRADHERAVHEFGGFGVPIIVFPWGRAVYGPVVAPAPVSGEAVETLWDLTIAYAKVEHLYELKTPKTLAAQRDIAELFSPYLRAREWRTIQNPAP